MMFQLNLIHDMLLCQACGSTLPLAHSTQALPNEMLVTLVRAAHQQYISVGGTVLFLIQGTKVTCITETFPKHFRSAITQTMRWSYPHDTIG